MAGAARRSITSCASRLISPALRWSGWSATIAPPGTFSRAASGLIAHNKGRLGKTLFTDDDPGRTGRQWRAFGTTRKKPATSATTSRRCARRAAPLDEMAILVRASFQMRAFEDRFVTLGLPYRVIGGPRFYERQEIKDAIAYLEVTLNPANDLKFERIINVPKRGLGDTRVRASSSWRGRAAIAAVSGRARDRGDGGADREGRASRWPISLPRSSAGAATSSGMKHTELAELILDESGYTRDVAAGQEPASPFTAGEPQGTRPLHARVRDPARLSGARVAGHGCGDAARARSVSR